MLAFAFLAAGVGLASSTIPGCIDLEIPVEPPHLGLTCLDLETFMYCAVDSETENLPTTFHAPATINSGKGNWDTDLFNVDFPEVYVESCCICGGGMIRPTLAPGVTTTLAWPAGAAGPCYTVPDPSKFDTSIIPIQDLTNTNRTFLIKFAQRSFAHTHLHSLTHSLTHFLSLTHTLTRSYTYSL